MAKLHQVFVGCPFTAAVRKPFDRLKKELEDATPLSIVLADTVGISSSDYLLEHITELIRDSAGCIFDATGANPNVSLEVGIAHTVPVDFILTFKTRKPRTAKGTSGSRAGIPRCDQSSATSRARTGSSYKAPRIPQGSGTEAISGEAALHETLEPVRVRERGDGAPGAAAVRRSSGRAAEPQALVCPRILKVLGCRCRTFGARWPRRSWCPCSVGARVGSSTRPSERVTRGCTQRPAGTGERRAG